MSNNTVYLTCTATLAQPSPCFTGCWKVPSPGLEGNKLQQPRLKTLYQDLWRTNNSNTFLLFLGHKTWYRVVSPGRCSLLPFRVGPRTYQHPGTCSSITSFTYACHTYYSKSYTVIIHNTSLLFADRKGRICTLLPYLVSIYEQKLITVIECLNFMFQHHVFLVTVQGMWQCKLF